MDAPLTPAILALHGRKPTSIKARSHLFSTDGGEKPFSGYSTAKAALNQTIAKLREESGRDPMPPWNLHDLRRTARSLSAERCLSHVIGGVRGIYDRWAYLPEKRAALDKLASLINRIVNPPTGDVTRYRPDRPAAPGEGIETPISQAFFNCAACNGDV
jgi:hypothetical protein